MGTLLYRFQEPDHLLLGTPGLCPPPSLEFFLLVTSSTSPHCFAAAPLKWLSPTWSSIAMWESLWPVACTPLLFGEGEPLVLLQPYLHWPADWEPLIRAESGYVFESICTGAAQACGCEFALTYLNFEVCMEGSTSGSVVNALVLLLYYFF